MEQRRNIVKGQSKGVAPLTMLPTCSCRAMEAVPLSPSISRNNTEDTQAGGYVLTRFIVDISWMPRMAIPYNVTMSSPLWKPPSFSTSSDSLKT